ncbi:MAG: hypothetical protein ACYC1B_04785, partial [Thermoleophilia bacterium]
MPRFTFLKKIFDFLLGSIVPIRRVTLSQPVDLLRLVMLKLDPPAGLAKHSEVLGSAVLDQIRGSNLRFHCRIPHFLKGDKRVGVHPQLAGDGFGTAIRAE